MGNIYLTRIAHFNAAHKLYNDKWSAEENTRIFGKCANANYHGHNYELHVTVAGNPSLETGFIFNAKTLGDILEEFVIEKIDHKNLNMDVDMMKGKLTSAENLTIAIWDTLVPLLKKYDVNLYEIKLFETHKIYVTYRG